MKLTEEEIFHIIKDLRPSKLEHPSSETLSTKIAEILNVKSVELENIVDDQFRAYKRDQSHPYRVVLDDADFDQNEVISNCFAMTIIDFFWIAFRKSLKLIFPDPGSACSSCSSQSISTFMGAH